MTLTDDEYTEPTTDADRPTELSVIGEGGSKVKIWLIFQEVLRMLQNRDWDQRTVISPNSDQSAASIV